MEEMALDSDDITVLMPAPEPPGVKAFLVGVTM